MKRREKHSRSSSEGNASLNPLSATASEEELSPTLKFEHNDKEKPPSYPVPSVPSSPNSARSSMEFDRQLLWGILNEQILAMGGNSNEDLNSSKFPDLEQIKLSEEVQKDPFKKILFDTPDEQLYILEEPKQRRTLESSIPEKILLQCSKNDPSIPPFVKECIMYYNAPYIRVEWNTPMPSSRRAYPNIVLASHNYEFLPQDEDNSGISLYPELLENSSYSNSQEKRKKENRFNPLHLEQLSKFSENLEWSVFSGFEFPSKTTDNSISILIEFKTLSFHLGTIEPFFGSAAVYDLSKKQKLTENIYFDLNTDLVSKLLPSEGRKKEGTNKVILKIPEPSPSHYLLVRIEKILQDDIETVTDPYIKYANLKEKDKEKLRSQAQLFCSRLSSFKQAFCWGILPLCSTNESTSVNLINSGENLELRPLWKAKETENSDSALLETLQESKSGSWGSKRKAIPGKCMLDIRVIDDKSSIDGRVNPSLVPVSPKLSSRHVVKELQTFSLSSLISHSDYINDLFIYPESLNFTSNTGRQGRNIAIKVQFLENDDNNSFPLPLIYSRNGENFQTEAWSGVTYHSKNPQFYDEIKIKLPVPLTSKHHILFSFYHVSCKQSKLNKLDSITTPLGSCFVPILQSKLLQAKEFSLPVAIQLCSSYLADEDQQIKYMDGKKLLFKFNIELISSIYPTDKYIQDFFDSYHLPEIHRSRISKAIDSLSEATYESLLAFSPIIFNQLFYVIGTRPENEAFAAFLDFNIILNKIGKNDYLLKNILQTYLNKIFKNPANTQFPVYERVTFLLSKSLKLKTGDLDVIRFAWFFLLIIAKSMILESYASKTKKKFSETLESELLTIVEKLMNEVITKSKLYVRQAQELNEAVATFITYMFALINIKVTFQMIQKVNCLDEQEKLIDFKFDFLRRVCSYDYIIQINLPVIQTNIDSIDSVLNNFSQTHFIFGFLLKQMKLHLKSPDKFIRGKAIITLKFLLQQLDIDPRYQQAPIKERIAGLFFPFLPLILDVASVILQDGDFEEKRTTFLCYLLLLKRMSTTLIQAWWKKETLRRLILFLGILSECLNVFEFVEEDKWKEKVNGIKVRKSDETKILLENFYQTASSKKLLRSSSKDMNRIPSLRSTRRLVSKKSRDDFGFKRNTIDTPESKNDSRNNSWRISRTSNYLYNPTTESNLSTEISFIILDILDEFVNFFQSDLLQVVQINQTTLLDSVMCLILTFFHKTNSEIFLGFFYQFLSAFIFKFSHSLFFHQTNNLSDLCFAIINHCNFLRVACRKQASSLLYLLMKRNYELTKKNFSKVKGQILIAVSKLVGTEPRTQNLCRSLEDLSKFDKASNSPKEFSSEIEQLTGRLYAILRDSALIAQTNSKDPELMADLYYRISQSYANSPDLRIAWLESLAKFHAQHNNFAESGQCFIYVAALVAEYLHLVDSSEEKVKGAKIFEHISPNVVSEVSSLKDIIDEEGAFESPTFSEQGFLKAVRDAIDHLNQGELYEMTNELYKIIIPIYERKRDYKQLAECHTSLGQAFTKVVETDQNRMLGSYYRIAFFGSKFEELDGKEFVYKEQKLTRLMEVKARLLKFYGEKFGGEANVNIISDTKTPDRNQLNQNIAYIQITAVKPYFPGEISNRITDYDKNTNLQSFIFASPYTLLGKPYADRLRDQYQRKTILTVEKKFPYITKRLIVVRKEEINLSPIDNSSENIETRTEEIRSVLTTTPPKVKTLQSLLQGSLMLQVNVGPAQVAKEFLGENASKYPPESVARCTRALKYFLEICKEALIMNKNCISTNQVLFQIELENSWKKLQASLEEYLGDQTHSIPPDDSKEPSHRNETKS